MIGCITQKRVIIQNETLPFKKIMLEGEDLVSKYTHYNRFVRELKTFHRLDSLFFNADSEIHFEGDCVKIDLKGEKSNAKIVRKANYTADRHNTKICFIPSERNMVSAIRNVNKAYKSSDYDALYNYLWEFDEAKTGLENGRRIEMPFDRNVAYYYDSKKEKDMVYLKSLDRSIETMYASSGVQSAMPIMVLLEYLISVVGTKRALSQKEIQNAIAKAVLDKDFLKPLHEQANAHLGLNKKDRLFTESNLQLEVLRNMATATNVIKSGHFKTGKAIPELTHSHLIGWWHNLNDQSIFMLQFNCQSDSRLYGNIRMNVYLRKMVDGRTGSCAMHISYLDLDDDNHEFLVIDTIMPSSVISDGSILDYIMEDQFIDEDIMDQESLDLIMILNGTMSFHRSRRF